MELSDLDKKSTYVSASRKEGMRLLYHATDIGGWGSHRLYASTTKTRLHKYLFHTRNFYHESIIVIPYVDMARLKNKTRADIW